MIWFKFTAASESSHLQLKRGCLCIREWVQMRCWYMFNSYMTKSMTSDRQFGVSGPSLSLSLSLSVKMDLVWVLDPFTGRKNMGAGAWSHRRQPHWVCVCCWSVAGLHNQRLGWSAQEKICDLWFLILLTLDYDFQTCLLSSKCLDYITH